MLSQKIISLFKKKKKTNLSAARAKFQMKKSPRTSSIGKYENVFIELHKRELLLSHANFSGSRSTIAVTAEAKQAPFGVYFLSSRISRSLLRVDLAVAAAVVLL